MALTKWTDTQILNQLISDARWYGLTISYGFPTSSNGLTGEDEKPGFKAFTASQQDIATLAINLWDDLIKPDVLKTTLTSNIDFAYTNTGIEFAHAYYPQDGTIWLNKNESVLTSPIIGEDGFLTFIHEIGHSIGLNHMGDYDGEGDWTPSSYQDTTVYTVMSYFGPDWEKGKGDVAWADWVGTDGKLYSPQTPALYDIQAIQKIYGAETTTRTGDTVYGFNSTILDGEKQIFDFTVNKNPIITIFDSEGIDTLDLSGWAAASQIDLTPGAFSSGNFMTNNIAIAFSATIENATGGKSNDRLTGNSANNALKGLGGNDELIGGLGTDTAIYSGNYKDYKISYDTTKDTFTVADQVPGRDGSDSVSEIEYFQFTDIKIASNELTPKDPVVGSTGDDLFKALIGDQDYNGLSGFDIITMSGHRADYQIYTSNSKILITDTVKGRDGSDMAVSIEELKFEDGVLLYDFSDNPTAASVYRLYKAAFARSPDEAGFRFWLDNNAKGVSLDEIAGSFRTSSEFVNKYGSSLNKQAYVDQLYLNVLGRSGELAGRDYWVEQLTSGKITDNNALIYFADSPENVMNTASNIDGGFWLV